MLTDCVFWFIIFPFLTEKDYSLNFVSKHTRAPCLLFLFLFPAAGRHGASQFRQIKC